MVRTFKRKDPLPALSELNVTPLIDLAFSLLIIFMITTPLLEQSIAVQLPTQATPALAPASPTDVHTLCLDAQGHIHWGKKKVSLSELTAQLQQMAQQAQQPILHIRAHASLPYQRIIDVIDAIQAQGLSKISLDTQAP
jgi:biopolymer transport protein ExbD